MSAQLAPDEALVTLSPTLRQFQSQIIADSTLDWNGWMEARKGGVSATFIRDVAKHIAFGKSPEYAVEKVKKDRDSFHGNQYTDWGNLREPVILDWVERRFMLRPSSALVAHPDFPKHIATPDGVGVDYDDRLLVAEVKTSKHDLDPGCGSGGTLQVTDAGWPDNHFWSTGYYDQMQWQMWVTGAHRTLFVWEQHNDQWPVPLPVGLEPKWCWVERDGSRIAALVELANWYLGNADDLAEMVVERAQDYTELADEWAIAERKIKYWTAKRDEVKAQVLDRIGDASEFTVDTPAAKITLVVPKPRDVFDEAAWAKRAPKAHADWVAANERWQARQERFKTEVESRFRKTVPGAARSLRFTPKKKEAGE